MIDNLALEFPAQPSQVAILRHRLTDWLDGAGVDEDATGNLVLAVSEAVSNAVEHAYQGPDKGMVGVRAETLPDGTVCISVIDKGTWRVPPATVSSRGRGLLLMRENVDEVLVDRTHDGTVVTLRLAPGTPLLDPEGPRGPIGHEVVVHEVSDGVAVVVRGEVPAYAGPTLRRTLTTLARGGSVPLTIDLGEFGAQTEGLVHALTAVAEAESAAGNRLTVHAPHDSPARRAVESLNGAVDLR